MPKDSENENELINKLQDTISNWHCDYCESNMVHPRNSNLLVVYPATATWAMIQIADASSIGRAKMLLEGEDSEPLDALDDGDEALDYVRVYEEETPEDEGGEIICRECIKEVDIEEKLRDSLSIDDIDESDKIN